MKTIVKSWCGILAVLWLHPAAAVGPGAATPHQPNNPNAVVKIDKQATQDRLDKKGKRSRKLDQARKPAPQVGH